MSSQVLTSELAIISSEAKRKFPEIRTAADKALQDLKALPNTSELQFTADVQRRPHIVSPLVQACKTRNPKLALPGITCLQRLILLKALPESSLADVLDALQECTSTGLDIQLKILQAIPTLLQNFSKHILGGLQANVLQICSSLQQTKTPAISRTAAATTQQAISFIFEKVEAEDEKSSDDLLLTEELKLEGSTRQVSAASNDAFRVFQDICLLTEGEKPQFITKATLAPVFGLELIESILSDHAGVFENHEEQQFVIRNRLVPLVTRLLSERMSYSVTVRTVRILCILIREHLDLVHGESEIALSLLNHSLDSDSGVPWRRALCMEALRLLLSEAELILDLFTYYDQNEKRRNIVQETLANFVRLAAEKPALIGVGQQSSFPVMQSNKASQDQAAIEAANVAGISGGDFGVSEVDVPGISTQFSTMRVPCLDQLDKSEPPQIPETYIYSLVLACTNNISEALAKAVLPLTLSREKSRNRTRADSIVQGGETTGSSGHENTKVRFRARSIPANPLDLKEHPAHRSVVTAVALIESCWPAIMATNSTFLYAALDAEFYRALIRAVQKFTQVAGLLRLATPRDAFLTSLSKAAIPPNVLKAETPTSAVSTPRLGPMSTFQSSDSVPSLNDPALRRASADPGSASLTQRNLMCLRALVNLAIALGPILDDAWSIILDAVQKASVVLANSGTMATARDYRAGSQGSANGDSGTHQTSLASEIAAVESAVTRMFHSTSEYPNDAFIVLMRAVCNLVEAEHGETQPSTPSLGSPVRLSRRASSISNISTSNTNAPQFDHFAIAKLGEIAKVNLQRLVFISDATGWDLLVRKLLNVTSMSTHDPTSRLMASDVLGSLAVESIAVSSTEDIEERKSIQSRSLSLIEAMIAPLQRHDQDVVKDIHKTALDALGAILERNGDSIVAGWPVIFQIIASVFDVGDARAGPAATLSGRLARSAFGSMQLICSDFLSSVPPDAFRVLTDLATRFCAQASDFNLSLTAITLCWNISDHALSNALSKGELDQSSQSLQTWMTIQDRLVPISTDVRSDVRNSVMHTIFRIFDSSGEKLPIALWQACMQQTLFQLLDLNVESHRSTLASDENSATISLIATSRVMLEGVGKLLGDYLEDLVKLSAFTDLWKGLLERLTSLLELYLPELSTCCFQALSEALSHASGEGSLGKERTIITFEMWAHHQPQFAKATKSREAEKATIAYVALQKQLMRQLQSALTIDDASVILNNFKHCIVSSAPAPYSSDVDSLTQLQQDVLRSIEELSTHVAGAAIRLIQTLSEFCALPYEKSPSAHTSEELTYVAFAKASMELLEKTILNHSADTRLFTNDTISLALNALHESIRRKYTWSRQGKDPALWQKATTVAVAILKGIFGALKGKPQLQDAALLSSVVKISDSIASADTGSLPDNPRLLEDESFDLNALQVLSELITPVLLDLDESDATFEAHVRSLLRMSFVHPPTSSDPALPSSHADIKKSLQAQRTGRTYDPAFNPRTRIAYFCLDKLFSLGWHSNLAFSYLTLRCATPLKIYIADQPLRGRMPTPTSQRMELMHLSKTIEGGGDKKQALLHRLAPLLNQALESTGDDSELRREIFGSVAEVLESVKFRAEKA